ATSAPAGGAEEELESLIASSAGQAPKVESKPGAGPLSLQSLQSVIQTFNPEISLNGDFLGAFSNNEGGKIDDEFIFRELEIGFVGHVDPYTKADVYVTLEHESNHEDIHADLEEAYLTYLGLPYNLQARFGQFRADFGRVNSMHLHALPWTDYPFVIKRYFGNEGLIGTGAELSWLVPNPWKQYIAIEYEGFNNSNPSVFA